MSHEAEQFLTKIFLSIQAIAGTAAILTTIASILGIILTLVSILAGVLVVAVNWEKGASQFRKWFKKDKSIYIKKHAKK